MIREGKSYRYTGKAGLAFFGTTVKVIKKMTDKPGYNTIRFSNGNDFFNVHDRDLKPLANDKK